MVGVRRNADFWHRRSNPGVVCQRGRRGKLDSGPRSLRQPDKHIVDASTNPSTVYYGLQYKSVDGGVTWSALSPLPGAARPGRRSLRGGSQREPLLLVCNGRHVRLPRPGPDVGADRFPGPEVAGIFPAGSSGTLFSVLGQGGWSAGMQSADGTAGFLTKISADGSTLEYSTYLRGHQTTAAISTSYREPIFFNTQNWISAIALDSAGNVIVAGGTRATDFPTAEPSATRQRRPRRRLRGHLSADGSNLNYSTYLGGSLDDGGLAAAIDAQGNVILAGQSWSLRFPGSRRSTGTARRRRRVHRETGGSRYAGDRLRSQRRQLSTWHRGGILGNDCRRPPEQHYRTWQTSDFVGDNLPTALDGVSVTIDGKPAYVEYISPTQINVQAPSDATIGAVNVVVDNNGVFSAPTTAQLKTAAPAFFLSCGGSSAVATVLPGYTPVTATAPAHPGDLVVLWGTGFGPTTPPAPAGVGVSGAPATSTLPAVTVGGMSVPVISSVLTTGTAGLYQITIQLPASVPTGAVAVQASVGGQQTQAGIAIFVEQ